MGECLRRVCPCLEALWQRILSDKKPAPGGGGGGGGGVSGGSEGERDSSGQGGGEVRPPSPSGERAGENSSIYMAVWPFEARHEDELSFEDGDLFSIISRSGDWWMARKIDRNGRVLDTGIVPNNYLARAESLRMQPRSP